MKIKVIKTTQSSYSKLFSFVWGLFLSFHLSFFLLMITIDQCECSRSLFFTLDAKWTWAELYPPQFVAIDRKCDSFDTTQWSNHLSLIKTFFRVLFLTIVVDFKHTKTPLSFEKILSLLNNNCVSLSISNLLGVLFSNDHLFSNYWFFYSIVYEVSASHYIIWSDNMQFFQ